MALTVISSSFSHTHYVQILFVSSFVLLGSEVTRYKYFVIKQTEPMNILLSILCTLLFLSQSGGDDSRNLNDPRLLPINIMTEDGVELKDEEKLN